MLAQPFKDLLWVQENLLVQNTSSSVLHMICMLNTRVGQSVVVRPPVVLVAPSVGCLNYLYLLASGHSRLIVEMSIS